MMMFDLFKRSSRPSTKANLKDQANTLLAEAMRGALDPALFGPGRIPDDFSGRFDAVTLAASLVSARLGDFGDEARRLNQAFVNALFRSFDDALREDGVGDLTVPKKMQKLAEAFYGRAASYRSAFELLDAGAPEGRVALEEAVFRNVLRSDSQSAGFSAALTDHAVAMRNILAALSLNQMLEGPIVWPRCAAAEGTV